MSEREKRKLRKQWKINSRNYRLRQKQQTNSGIITPCTSEEDNSEFENQHHRGTKNLKHSAGSSNAVTSGKKKSSGRKKVRKDRASAYRKLKKLELKIQ